MAQTIGRVGHDELATLKLVALDGALDGNKTITCSDLAGRLDVSTQTASRRLQRLDDCGYLAREFTGGGQRLTLTDEGERALQREYADYRRLFEGAVDVTLAGTVTSGMGEGSHYITLSGYMRQFRNRLGYEPFAGTLNVDLHERSVKARARMDAMSPIEIGGWADDDRTYGPAFCWPATVETAAGDRYETCHIIAPERTHYDAGQLEVIAPDELREVLSVDDTDELKIHVSEQ